MAQNERLSQGYMLFRKVYAFFFEIINAFLFLIQDLIDIFCYDFFQIFRFADSESWCTNLQKRVGEKERLLFLAFIFPQ